MTYGCARCHDHKFDPILQKDYYRLQAFFANIREQDDRCCSPARSWKRTSSSWRNGKRGRATSVTRCTQWSSRWPKRRRDYYSIRFSEGTKAALKTPPEKRTPLQKLLAIKAMPQITYEDRALVNFKDDEFGTAELTPEQKKHFAELDAELQKFESPETQSADGADDYRPQPEAPKSFVLGAGNWDVQRKKCSRDFFRFSIPAMRRSPRRGPELHGRRSALANWLADPQNPLTPRVMANRIWHYHFGRGIVRRPAISA